MVPPDDEAAGLGAGARAAAGGEFSRENQADHAEQRGDLEEGDHFDDGSHDCFPRLVGAADLWQKRTHASHADFARQASGKCRTFGSRLTVRGAAAIGRLVERSFRIAEIIFRPVPGTTKEGGTTIWRLASAAHFAHRKGR